MPSQYLSVESLELTPRNTFSALRVHEIAVAPDANRPAREDQHLLGNFRETSEQLTRLRKWLVFVLCMGVGMGVAGAALRFYSSSDLPALLRFGAANELPFASVERKTLVKNSALWAPVDPAAATAPFPTGAWWSNLVVRPRYFRLILVLLSLYINNKEGTVAFPASQPSAHQLVTTSSLDRWAKEIK